jgi:hypothetical protein
MTMCERIDDDLAREFLDFIDNRGLAPESWCEDVQLPADEWIFDGFGDCDEPSWYHDLPNVRRGIGNTIDNCVGEFFNFHLGVADFLSLKTGKEVKLVEEPWFDTADVEYSGVEEIKFKMNGKVFSVPRAESTDARDSVKGLGAFLKGLIEKASTMD